MFSGKLRLSEGEDDFIGDVDSSRSNLSDIFGVSLPKNEDNSLKYVPPKQEDQIEGSLKPALWNVQVAKVVSAFKLVDQKYVLEGKIGLALLKSRDDLHKIILYRTKSKILSTFTMDESAKVFIKSPYFQFCDDLQIFWSVLFENGEEHDIIVLIKDKIKIEESSSPDEEPIEKCVDEAHNCGQKYGTGAPKVGTNSSDERLNETKAQILSRMAKMGKPLPKLSAATTDFSDSSDTEVRTKLFTKPVAVPRKPKGQPLSTAASSKTQLIPTLNTFAAYNHNFNAESQCLNMLVTENRTQNAEIRINMSKLEAKIEKVLDKIDIMGSKSTTSCGKYKDDEILELEEKLLLLKKENRVLRIKIDELMEKSSRSATDKSCEGDNTTEFNHLFEMFGVNKDEYENSEQLLKDLIRKYSAHCESLNTSIDSLKANLEDYTHRIQLIELEKEEEISGILEENGKLKKSIQDMEQKLEKLKVQNQVLEMREQYGPATEIKIETTLKDIMNNFYQTLVGKFRDKDNFTTAEILRICGGAIKEETSNIINKRNCSN